MRAPGFSVSKGGGQGPSPWLVVDYLQRPFVEGLFASLSFDNNAITYQVEHTPDNPNVTVPVSISRATTVATLTRAAHGLVVGDSVTVINSGSANLDGVYPVASVVDANNLTYTVANSGATAGAATAQAALCRVFIDATLTAKTAKAYAANSVPVLASRINVTAWTAGTATLQVVQGHARG